MIADVCRQCGNAWSGFENKSQEVGSERKSKKEEVQGEILAYQEEQRLPEELHEGGGQESCYERGDGVREDVESACNGFGSNGKIEIEETDGSSSGQKEDDLFVPFHGGLGLEVEEDLFTQATRSIGQKKSGRESGIRSKMKLG